MPSRGVYGSETTRSHASSQRSAGPNKARERLRRRRHSLDASRQVSPGREGAVEEQEEGEMLGAVRRGDLGAVTMLREAMSAKAAFLTVRPSSLIPHPISLIQGV